MSTYVAIQTINLTSDASSVSFTGIPQTFNDLILVASIKCNTTDTNIKIQMNNDTSSSYSLTYIGGNGTSTESGRASNQTSMDTAYQKANVWGNIVYNFNNYTNTTNNKAVVSRSSNASSLTAAYVGLWRKTEAITSIKLISSTTNISSGSNFTLYGIGSGSPKAFGGDIVKTDGTYWYHIFNSSGKFTPVQSLTVDYLVVAGGGGGSFGAGGGGGGAGGFRTSVGSSTLSLTAQPYTVTIGAGGAGGTSSGDLDIRSGKNGTDSVFSSVTSTGGGGGQARRNGASGGSGGGASRGTSGSFTGGAGNTPSTTPSQGNNGGDASTTNFIGGGGGGASAAGGSVTGNNGGAGGAGTASSLSGTSVTYAGGGGGSANYSPVGTAGAGGAGGGGSAGASVSVGTAGNGTAGTANTGGGGGAGGTGPTDGNGAAGGSGIVIVRYPV